MYNRNRMRQFRSDVLLVALDGHVVKPEDVFVLIDTPSVLFFQHHPRIEDNGTARFVRVSQGRKRDRLEEDPRQHRGCILDLPLRAVSLRVDWPLKFDRWAT
jgi:hypothetical protein